MSTIIYLLTNTANQKQYVGKTAVGLERRWKEHCRDASRGSILHLHSAIRKYGSDAFIKEIIEQTTVEDANNRETHWIAELKTKTRGYNMTEGGDGGDTFFGKTHSLESRTKMSISHTGKVLTTEHKKNVGLSGIGRKLSLETKAKLSAARMGKCNPFYGKNHSDETRAKMSAALTGKKLSAQSIAKRTATRKLYARMKRIMTPLDTIRVNDGVRNRRSQRPKKVQTNNR